MGSRPIELLQESGAMIGDIFGLVVAGNRMFIINDPHSYNVIIKPVKELDNGLHSLTQRMEVSLLKCTNGVQNGEVLLYDFLARMIFSASIAALFNADAGDDTKLFDAFQEFDKVIPIAAAGVDLKYFSVGNTMPATFWLLYYLLSDPALLAQAKKEITDTFASGSNPSSLSQDQLNGMVFMDACITEALRLSSGSLIMRFVNAPCRLTMDSGKVYKFRKGDRIGLFPTLMHYDEEIFPNAMTFNPSRWLQGETQEERVAGAGIAYCPGRRFTRNEIKILAAFLLTRLDFTLIANADSKLGSRDAPQKVVYPGVDGSRAGIGIFPPKSDVRAY
eukprot:gene29595-36670_t